jgi:hypothetical protein
LLVVEQERGVGGDLGHRAPSREGYGASPCG